MDQRVQRILVLMRENLHKELSLEEFAETVNLSVWRLSHIFKSETGQSPINYLRTLRMERAGYLLETSFLSIKEVAHAVGVNDGSHFARDFKTIHGVTPTQYRTLINNGGHLNEPIDPEAMEHQSKIRQRIARAANGSILPSMATVMYTLACLANRISFCS